MGRYAEPLAEVFVAFAGVGIDDKVLDVGCGPGALTKRLLSLGVEVAAIDPSPPFIEAIRARFPEIDVRIGTAEELPYDTAAFDAALAQLVVHFMKGPVVAVRQMARVTRQGGVVAAIDHGAVDEAHFVLAVAVRNGAIAGAVDERAVDDVNSRSHWRMPFQYALFTIAGVRDAAAVAMDVQRAAPFHGAAVAGAPACRLGRRRSWRQRDAQSLHRRNGLSFSMFMTGVLVIESCSEKSASGSLLSGTPTGLGRVRRRTGHVSAAPGIPRRASHGGRTPDAQRLRVQGRPQGDR